VEFAALISGMFYTWYFLRNETLNFAILLMIYVVSHFFLVILKMTIWPDSVIIACLTWILFILHSVFPTIMFTLIYALSKSSD